MKTVQKGKYIKLKVAIMLMITLCVASPIVHAAVSLPNPPFTSGNVISSDAVNKNFSTLANAMPAAKIARSTSYTLLPTSGAVVNCVSLTVTPPVSGYVLLTGIGNVGISNTTANPNHAIFLYLTDVSASTSSNVNHIYFSPPTPSGWSYYPFSVSAIYYVTGGVAKTFYLTAEREAATSDYIYVGNYSNDITLSAIFVPTLLP